MSSLNLYKHSHVSEDVRRVPSLLLMHLASSFLLEQSLMHLSSTALSEKQKKHFSIRFPDGASPCLTF